MPAQRCGAHALTRHLGSTSAHRLGERSSATSMARIVAPELNTIAVRGGELYSVLYSVHRNGQYGVCPSIQSSKVFCSSENPQEVEKSHSQRQSEFLKHRVWCRRRTQQPKYIGTS